MVKIRLRRVGARNNPKYRLVAADSRAPRDGRFIETLGHYDPIQNPEVLKLDQDRILEWLKKGAQPSDGALRLLYKAGILRKAEAGKQARPKGASAPAPAPAAADSAKAAGEKRPSVPPVPTGGKKAAVAVAAGAEKKGKPPEGKPSTPARKP